MQIRGHRAERLAEHDVRAAVHETDRLGVALDGHRRHRALGGELDHLDPHSVGERPEPAFPHPIEFV